MTDRQTDGRAERLAALHQELLQLTTAAERQTYGSFTDHLGDLISDLND